MKHLIDVAQESSDKTGDGWSDSQTARFLSLAREACARIRSRHAFPATELQNWSILDGKGVFARGATEVLSGPVVELGEAIVALVEGILPAAPAGTSWLYGAPEGRSTLPCVD